MSKKELRCDEYFMTLPKKERDRIQREYDWENTCHRCGSTSLSKTSGFDCYCAKTCDNCGAPC